MGYDTPGKGTRPVSRAPAYEPKLDAPVPEPRRRRARSDAPVSVLNQSLEERASSGLSYRSLEQGNRSNRRKPFSSGGF